MRDYGLPFTFARCRSSALLDHRYGGVYRRVLGMLFRGAMTTNWVRRNLSGWGRYPVVEADVARPERMSDVSAALEDRDGRPLLAHGLGRSYGDAALIEDGAVVLTRRLDRMLAFDPETGWLRCEAGVSIDDIIETFLPRGYFPPVVPGTKFVTVGGAVGCNIHGGNHHVDGCFGDHVRRLELLTASGEVVVCDRDDEPELFWATVGGMGLTGLILSLEVKLIPVESRAMEMETVRVENLDEFFEVSERISDQYTHAKSWIDCTQTGRAMGRGVFMAGRHAPAGAEPSTGFVDRLVELIGRTVDGRHFESDLWLNPVTMKLFNEAFFRKEARGTTRSVVDHVPFLFPLDAVPNWNYLYGKRGFFQYQFVVDDRDAVREALRITTKTGMASFLCVIKEFGDRDHGGLSFPKAGTTVALDFPNLGAPLFELFDRLDEVVLDAKGRVYLGKDARLPRDRFQRMYPEWERWKEVRDRWDPDRVFQSELGRRLGLV